MLLKYHDLKFEIVNGENIFFGFDLRQPLSQIEN